MLGLDTTAIIDIFKGDIKIKKVLENAEQFASTIINHQEIMFGLDSSSSAYKFEEVYYDEFFQDVRVFLHNKETSKKAAEIFWKLKKQGKSIGRFDCMIAAILLSNGVNRIITRNKKHFENIKGLKVISY